MEIYTNCPKCHDALLNDYSNNSLFQSCKKYVDHQIFFWSDKGKVFGVAIQIYPNGSNNFVFCNLRKKFSKLYDGPTSLATAVEISVPYFEPDFSNYDALIKKFRTYITFS
jgi:hypothetical protein